jgi:hypothetical protein
LPVTKAFSKKALPTHPTREKTQFDTLPSKFSIAAENSTVKGEEYPLLFSNWVSPVILDRGNRVFQLDIKTRPIRRIGGCRAP